MSNNSNVPSPDRLSSSTQPSKYKKFAITEHNSRGRIIPEIIPQKDYREAFQHDKDRIIHSRAFRRLEAKTQVVLTNENDHSRTRLTHSLEVSQISESIAIKLGLNTFATRAIALGHDIGHAPFGHTGERALSKILVDFGLDGFKHNYQGVLVVNKLEKPYEGDSGLNLMWETRDGILKHSKLWPESSDNPDKRINLKYYDPQLDDERHWPLTLEGQIVGIVDEIAQRTHDTDDALRTKRIDIRELIELKFIKKILKYNSLDKDNLIYKFSKDSSVVISTIIASMIKSYVHKTIESSQDNIEKYKIKTYDDVKNAKNEIIAWDREFHESDEDFADNFLRPQFYFHHEIRRMDSRGEFFLKKIFEAFHNNPKQLPDDTFTKFKEAIIGDLKKHRNFGGKDYSDEIDKILNSGNIECLNRCAYISKSKYPTVEQIEESHCPFLKFENHQHACEGIRVIINHIAGMTDRYAHLEYSRLYLPPGVSKI